MKPLLCFRRPVLPVFRVLPALSLLTLPLLTLSLLIGCAQAPSPSAQDTGVTGASDGAGGADPSQPTIYTCPMHPSIRQDHPGKCPLCGMNLVKVEPAEVSAGSGASSGVASRADAGGGSQAPTHAGETAPLISLDSGLLQRVGMTTMKVKREALGDEVRVPGVVTLDERTLRVVSARTGGRIEQLRVNAVGMRVSRGQALLELYSPSLLATQQEYLIARRQETGADLPLEAGNPPPDSPAVTRSGPASRGALKRLELSGMSREQVQRLEQTGEVIPNLTVMAPSSGTVLEKQAVEGAYVSEGSVLYRLAELSQVWVLAQLPEERISLASPGTLVKIQGPDPALPPLTGRVERVYPAVDAASRTVQARIPVSNPGEKLLPGMSVTVTLVLPVNDGLTVPAASVVRTGELPLVFVPRGDHQFEPRAVRLGREAAGRIEILQGLQEGEDVVAAGAFLIDAQTRITGGAAAQYAGALAADPAGSGSGDRASGSPSERIDVAPASAGGRHE